MAQQNSGAVDTRHRLYRQNQKTYQMIEDCVNGEDAVKSRGFIYLPAPNPHEHDSKDPDIKAAAVRRYEGYSTRARFLNATGRTLNGMLGIAFSEPVNLTLDGALKELAQDADGKGQPLTQLLRDAMAEVLKTGRAYIMADYTGSGEATSNRVGDAFLRIFYSQQIINWRESKGKTTLVVLKYTEDVEDESGFENQERTVWLELRMVGGVAHARKWYSEQGATADTLNQSSTDLVPLADINNKPLQELPGAWLGSVNNDSFPDPAPLADIASINIGHYQTDADVVEAARIVGQPTLVVAGLTEAWADKYLKGGITVGATSGILLNQNATASILQANETSASTNLKEQRAKEMAMLGAKLLERGSAAKTATQADYEAQTDNSILSLCASNTERAMNKALELLALMVGGSGTVEINKRYDMSGIDATVLTALMAQVQAGALSLHNFIRYQQKVGLVSPDLTVEEVEDELRSQAPLPGMTDLNTESDNPDDPQNNEDQ